MTRRIKRHQQFDLTLQIHSDDFIRTPRPAQRNWLLNRVVKEFSDDLLALDAQAREFIRGGEAGNFGDRRDSALSEQQIMEDWQIPVMRAMADAVTASHGDILEIGFGRGIASDFIQQCGVASHTIIECNPQVVQQCEHWRERRPNRSIHIVPGLWQDVIDQLNSYDGVFFHTYPLTEQDHIEQVVRSTTFAEHFFPTAAGLLRPGGSFSYLSNETDSLSRGHQRLLFRHFSSFTLSRVQGLKVPEDSHDVQWSDSMVIIKAVK